MSAEGNPFQFLSLIATIITGVIVAVLYLTTRFGKGETRGAVIHTQTTQIVKSIEEMQNQFKETQKEIKGEVRDLSREVQALNNTLNLQQYTSNEIKQTAHELQSRVTELEKKIYDLSRRAGLPRTKDENNNSSYWCI